MTRYTNHQKRRQKMERRIIHTLGIALGITVVLAFICSLAGFGWDKVGIACAAFPLIPGSLVLMAPEGEGGGGGGTITDAEFRTKALAAIEGVKAGQKAITDNIATIDKEGKKLSEDFAKHVKTFDGLPDQVKNVEMTMRKLELKIAAEYRAAFGGGALAMIRANEEVRTLVNAIVRGNASQHGRSLPMTGDQRKAMESWKKAVGEDSSPGSTYINDALYTGIYALIAEYGVWNVFDVITAGTKTTKLIIDSTDPEALFVAENTAPSEASYTGTSVSATVKKILAWLSISNELLEDAEVDVTGFLLPKFARAVAKRLDHISIAADGTDDTTDGAFTGIFAGGTAKVAASGNVSVATLDLEDWLDTMLTVNAAALSRPCKWWMHPQMVVRALKIKDLNGRPIFLPAIDAPAPGAVGSILGYPVVLSHIAPNTDGTSKQIAAFGDPMGNAVLLRKDLEFAASDQVMFKEDSTVFRARARAASKVRQSDAFAVLTTAAS